MSMNVHVDDREFDGIHRAEEGKITLRTQGAGDKSSLLKLCPHDQVVACQARWSDDGISLVIEPKASHSPGTSDAPAPNEADRAKLMAMNDADLQTYAAERNVEWDAKASKKTMVDRVLKGTGGKKS
jgi:hypothetical protein